MPPAAPCEGAKIVSSIMGMRLRLLGGWCPSDGNGFPFEVISLSMIGCFFEAMAFGGFFKNLVREKSKYWDSDLNESISLS